MERSVLDEVLERLEALERAVRLDGGRGELRPAVSRALPAGTRGGITEKRLVDLIVLHVAEHVDEIVEQRLREQIMPVLQRLDAIESAVTSADDAT
jgi:hypothetical protein